MNEYILQLNWKIQAPNVFTNQAYKSPCEIRTILSLQVCLSSVDVSVVLPLKSLLCERVIHGYI